MSDPLRPAAVEYAARRDRRAAESRELDRSHRLISWLRLVVFAAGLALVWAVWRGVVASVWWLLPPAVLFGILMAFHNRVLRRRERASRAVGHYAAGLDRLAHRWAGRGRTGRRFRRDEHPYAGELDLFDRGGLFELLCTARTTAGEETLARWLQTAAPPDVIRSRQAAVHELREALELREDLAILGQDVQEEIHPDALVSWCEAPSPLPGPAARRLAAAVTALTVTACLVVPAAGWPWSALVPVLAVQAAFAGSLRRRVRSVVDHVDRPGRELALLASLLERLESEVFRAPHLTGLRRSLATEGHPPSRRVRMLTRWVHALDWRRNTLFAPVAALLMWPTHIAFCVEAWRRTAGLSVERWLRAVGEMEALAALAGYAYEHPADPFPEIVEAGPLFAGEGLGHPLLPEETCVRNDVRLDDRCRLLVVSGSNMSGKTTLLRTVGINAVLAQAGAPVRARRLALSPLQVGASVRHQDSIQAGHSRFYAEILRIRHLVELAGETATVLFLLDEILHGTNSHDRRIGAEAIVRGLLERRAIGLVTTHDLALASLAEAPGTAAMNVHFEDQIVDGRMRFDYRMRSGVVRKSNALELMRSVGLEV